MHRIRKTAAVALAALLVLVSCRSDDDDPPPGPGPGGYQLTVEDTLITIPSIAVNFARDRFNRDAQLLREFRVATNADGHTWVSPPWGLGLGVWKSETFDVRQQYLVAPYFFDVMTPDSAFFYYQIGTFINQFGYGWEDTFDVTGFVPDSTYANHIWPTDPTATAGFDGQSAYVAQYRGMWILE